jgi:hypothetical protein
LQEARATSFVAGLFIGRQTTLLSESVADKERGSDPSETDNVVENDTDLDRVSVRHKHEEHSQAWQALRRRRSVVELKEPLSAMHEHLSNSSFAVYASEFVGAVDAIISEFRRYPSEEIYAAILQAIGETFFGSSFPHAQNSEHLDAVDDVLTCCAESERLADGDLHMALDKLRATVGTTLPV